MSGNCGQLASGGTNGAFYEAQNEAANHPQVVDAMVKEILVRLSGSMFLVILDDSLCGDLLPPV